MGRKPNRRSWRGGRRLAVLRAATALAAAGICGWSSQVSAATSNWQTASSGDWLTSSNWSSGVPNGGGANAVVAATGGAYTVTLANDVSLNDLTLNSSDATINQTAGTLTINGADIQNGEFKFGGADLTGTGTFTNHALFTTNNSAGTDWGNGLTFNNTGTLTRNGAAFMRFNGTAFNNSGVVNLQSGGELQPGCQFAMHAHRHVQHRRGSELIPV